MRRHRGVDAGGAVARGDRRRDDRIPPRPRVAEPQRRQQMQRGRLRPAVVRGHAHDDVVVGDLRVFDLDVEVAPLVEDPGVQQLVLRVVLRPAAVRPDQIVIGVRALGVLVEALHVRVRRRRVEVEPVLLDVLAVVALAVGQPEHPLLEDRILPVPQGEREAEPLLIVADAGDAVLTPSIRARAGMVVREVVPGVAAPAVVLAHGAPLAFAQIGPPRLPRNLAGPSRFQALVLRSVMNGRHRCMVALRAGSGITRFG